MFNLKANWIPVFCLVLLFAFSAFGQEKGHHSKTKARHSAGKSKKTNTTNQARYANQEISYRQAQTTATVKQPDTTTQLDKGDLPPTAKTTNQRRGSILPYMEQSNLRRRASQKRK